MFSSPFQQPSPRQNLLASQIQEAQRCGDERQLLLLSGQWVHRFGINSLPVHDASFPDTLVQSLNQLDTGAVLSPTPPSEEPVEADDAALCDEVSPQEEFPQEVLPPAEITVAALVVGIPQPSDELVESDDAASLECSPPQERFRQEEITGITDVLESSPAPLQPVADRKVVVAMSAPPISTPRSLRRWLPRADQTFPQAS